MQKLRRGFGLNDIRGINAANAYNLWSPDYDHQPDNLMLHLDNIVFKELLGRISINNKNIVDFGCGTGRHWDKIFSDDPEEITGVDISEGMLAILKNKYPSASVYKINDNLLTKIESSTVDVIVCTLTIAHVKNINELFESWKRILKNGGDLIVTDFHPQLLNNGGRRDFKLSGKNITIKNYVHMVEEVEAAASANGFMLLNKQEKFINEDVRSFYEKQNALHVYQHFFGMPVIYGMHLKKL
ncbi:MAG TPA: class I SAM-dependent methyltransferase [Flavisolibacter sp.]|nr:class I SAM-dependent methyltransferase [Flavisolibacter sp.]